MEQMVKCPLCGTENKRTYYSEDVGLVEDHYACTHCGYTEEMAYSPVYVGIDTTIADDGVWPSPKRMWELAQADKDGRLVVLPCKVNDKLYVVGEKRIIRCDICEAYLDDKKGLEYLVSFECDSDCNGCPFNNWGQDYSGEWSCDGEYGQSVVVGSDIGKTVFLTCEEAEEALKKEDNE